MENQLSINRIDLQKLISKLKEEYSDWKNDPRSAWKINRTLITNTKIEIESAQSGINEVNSKIDVLRIDFQKQEHTLDSLIRIVYELNQDSVF